MNKHRNNSINEINYSNLFALLLSLNDQANIDDIIDCLI